MALQSTRVFRPLVAGTSTIAVTAVSAATALPASTIQYRLVNSASPGLKAIAADTAAVRTASEQTAASLGRLETKLTKTGQAAHKAGGQGSSGGLMGFMNAVSPVQLTRVHLAAGAVVGLGAALVAVGFM